MTHRDIDDEVIVIDDGPPTPPRSRQELAVEAILLLPNTVKLLLRLMSDRRVSMRRKAFIGAVLLYIISPVDLIPDFVIGIGRLDDVILVSLAIDHLMSGADEEIVREHWDGTEDGLDLVRSAFGWAASIIPDSVRSVIPR
jgi:uncharacterized membrane protein YkvA (DUF1232 family)